MAKAHTLTDNFNDDVTDTVKWSPFGQEVTEANQRVEVRPLGNTPNTYAGYVSVSTYDLTDSESQLGVLRLLRRAPGAEVFLSAGADDSNRILLLVRDGRLSCGQVVAGTSTDLASVWYDALPHRWWRLRERLGMAYWEVSPDGKQWTACSARPTR